MQRSRAASPRRRCPAAAAARHHCQPCPAASSLPLAAQYGWSGAGPEELDNEQAEVFQEAYAADPTWAAQGPALLQRPQLAGGRLVVELTSLKEAPKVWCTMAEGILPAGA